MHIYGRIRNEEDFKFFNNLPSRKRPSTVFRLKRAFFQPATDCHLMEGKLSIRAFSPSSISFNDNAIRRKKVYSSKLFKDLPPT